MVKKLVLLIVVVFGITFGGCTSERVTSENVKNGSDIDNQYTESHNIHNKDIEGSNQMVEKLFIPVTAFRVYETFDQGGIVTLVKDILLYSHEENNNCSIIQFNLQVRNNSDKDAYMLYDISPIVLNTGEQKDDTDRCTIHRVFKSAVKEGELVYEVKSRIESIKTIRWVLAGPLHNYTNADSSGEIIGGDCDFTFNLDLYPKNFGYKAINSNYL